MKLQISIPMPKETSSIVQFPLSYRKRDELDHDCVGHTLERGDGGVGGVAEAEPHPGHAHRPPPKRHRRSGRTAPDHDGGELPPVDHVRLRERQHVPPLCDPALRRAHRVGLQRCLLPLELGTETQTAAQVVFGGFCGLVPGLALLLALVGVFGQTKGEVGTMLGYVGVAFSLSMFSSPLGTLKHVVSTKNAASIPINMCVMILISTALWVGSGLAGNDYFVAGVNGAGVLLSCVQIVVYNIYRPSRREEATLIQHHDSPNNASVMVSSPKDENYNSVFVESPAFKPMTSPVIMVAA